MQTETPPAVWESPLLPGITFSVLRVTPEIAGEWLLLMDKQRKESLERSDRYALDMADHGWLFTADPWRFDSNGAFMDGQHRAQGVVKSGQSQIVLVVRGLDPDVLRVLDSGFKRTFTNLLQMAEVPNPSYVAAIAKAHFLWDQGLYGQRNIARIPDPERFGIDPTHPELWAHFGRHPQLIECAKAAGRMGKLFNSRTVTRTSLGLVWMVLTKIDPYKRDEFFGQVAGEVDLTDTRPGYAPRVLGDRLSRRTSLRDAPVPQWGAVSMLFRGWNAWVTGERPDSFRVPRYNQIKSLTMPIDPGNWTPESLNAANGDNE
jgi:hypothetical protein